MVFFRFYPLLSLLNHGTVHSFLFSVPFFGLFLVVVKKPPRMVVSLHQPPAWFSAGLFFGKLLERFFDFPFGSHFLPSGALLTASFFFFDYVFLFAFFTPPCQFFTPFTCFCAPGFGLLLLAGFLQGEHGDEVSCFYSWEVSCLKNGLNLCWDFREFRNLYLTVGLWSSGSFLDFLPFHLCHLRSPMWSGFLAHASLFFLVDPFFFFPPSRC